MTTNCNDLVALVVGKSHYKYGEIGKVLKYIIISNSYFVKFLDRKVLRFGNEADLNKGIDAEVEIYLRNPNSKEKEAWESQGRGVEQFKKRYRSLGGVIDKLSFDYRKLFNEELP